MIVFTHAHGWVAFKHIWVWCSNVKSIFRLVLFFHVILWLFSLLFRRERVGSHEKPNGFFSGLWRLFNFLFVFGKKLAVAVSKTTISAFLWTSLINWNCCFWLYFMIYTHSQTSVYASAAIRMQNSDWSFASEHSFAWVFILKLCVAILFVSLLLCTFMTIVCEKPSFHAEKLKIDENFFRIPLFVWWLRYAKVS